MFYFGRMAGVLGGLGGEIYMGIVPLGTLELPLMSATRSLGLQAELRILVSWP